MPECAALKAELLARVAALALPPNFLDHMIDQLGGPKVRRPPSTQYIVGLHAEPGLQGTVLLGSGHADASMLALVHHACDCRCAAASELC